MAFYTQQQADFIATELPYARAESRRTGIPVSVFLTQSAYETGWGTSSWFRNFNNPAGIGVTGAAGAGFHFKTLGAAFRVYADKLLGIGEAGQQQFAADVRRHADAQTLLSDLEASPWAAGHYGGHGLNTLYAGAGLGTFDNPHAKAPTGGVPIQLTAYIPGTHVHIPGTGAGGSIIPSNPVTGAAGAVVAPLVDFVKQGAIRAALVVFGLVAIVVGLALLVRDAGETHAADTAGKQAAAADRAQTKAEPPAERAEPEHEAPAGEGPAVKAPRGAAQDVRDTAEGAAAAAAG